MKKILITGGLGFIGSNLAERCVNLGHKVTILSMSDSKIENINKIKGKIKLILLDVKKLNKQELKGYRCIFHLVEEFDYIFHLAGTVDNYNIFDDPYKDIDVNCNGTIALLEACRKYNPKARIVYASTFFVNGNSEKLPVNSSSPCNPLGLYGATRLAGEQFCKTYNKVFGMNSVIARFTNVFGVREQAKNKKKAGFNYLINLALEEKEISLYINGNFIRDYIYVDDVVDACLIIAEKGEADKIYYVGRGESVKFKDLIDIVMKEVGRGKVKSVKVPAFHNAVGIRDFACDTAPLKKLGWKPKISLEEGIRRTIAYYKLINEEKIKRDI